MGPGTCPKFVWIPAEALDHTKRNTPTVRRGIPPLKRTCRIHSSELSFLFMASSFLADGEFLEIFVGFFSVKSDAVDKMIRRNFFKAVGLGNVGFTQLAFGDKFLGRNGPNIGTIDLFDEI